ncbi:MAG: TolC family protein [Bacteroidota bacterium]|nr:TolC family protein [Bacteroidota bacterium]
MKALNICILTLLIALSNWGFSQEVKSFSLREAQDFAIQNSAEVKNAKLDNVVAQKKIWEILSMGLPQINATGNYQHQFIVPSINFGGQTNLVLEPAQPAGTPLTSDMVGKQLFLKTDEGTPIPLGLKNNTTFDFTLSQLVFSGSYIVGLQASKIYYQISDQNYQKSKIEMKESIANTYCMVLILEGNLNILQNSLSNLKKTLSDMREINKQGLNEDTDVDQIELTSLNVENAVSTVKRQVDAAYDLLKFQMGMPLENKVTLRDNLEDLLTSIDIANINGKQFNVRDNITYKIMNTQEQFSKLVVREEISNYLPNLSGFYRHTEKVNQPEFDFTPKDIFGLTLNIPILSSGQRIVKVQQRKMELDKVSISKQKAIEGVKLDYSNALNDMNSTYEKYLNEKKNIDLTKRIYDKTIIKFQEGISTSLDLTQVNNQYLTAQTNYFDAIYKLLTAKNKLDRILNNE